MTATVVRRNRPGTTSKDLFQWPEQALEEMDSSFSLQQYIQATLFNHPSDIDGALALPESQDDEVTWQYEHFRQICQDLNFLVTKLLAVCTPSMCPVMKATVDDQQQYLCACHKQPQECCAIDYITHLLDSSASILNSSKNFPSRVTIPSSSTKHFQPLARRLYRIFAHAYHQHRREFDEFESQSHLLERFLKFCKKFDLLPDTSLIPISYES